MKPGETDELSPAELTAYFEAGRKREQRQAFMLHTHAALCRAAMDGKLPEVWETFPFWEQKEIYQIKAERMRTKLMKQVK